MHGGHAGPVTMGRITRGPLSWTRPHCGMPFVAGLRLVRNKRRVSLSVLFLLAQLLQRRQQRAKDVPASMEPPVTQHYLHYAPIRGGALTGEGNSRDLPVWLPCFRWLLAEPPKRKRRAGKQMGWTSTGRRARRECARAFVRMWAVSFLSPCDPGILRGTRIQARGHWRWRISWYAEPCQFDLESPAAVNFAVAGGRGSRIRFCRRAAVQWVVTRCACISWRFVNVPDLSPACGVVDMGASVECQSTWTGILHVIISHRARRFAGVNRACVGVGRRTGAAARWLRHVD
jgi:hypothetical protein